MVRAGTYSVDVVTDQGIAVLCDPGAALHADDSHGSGLGVAGVPAGRVFSMRGGSISSLFPAARPLVVADNQGAIAFGRLAPMGVAVLRSTAESWTAESCRQRALGRCR